MDEEDRYVTYFGEETVSESKRSENMTKTCFVIAPIGDEESDTRKRSDQILKHIISPAAKECGYEALRADQISEPGIITSQVIQHIVDDPLVIADLTGRNPNVFYELALRHALKKPLVQVIKKGEQIPFDVAGMRTVPVDHHDLDSVEEAKGEIISQIRSVEDKGPEQIETPISVSIELQFLRQSENPEERSLADLVSSMSDLRSGLASLEKKISNPETILPPGYLQTVLKHVARRRALPERALFDIEHILRGILSSKAVDKKSPEYSQLNEATDYLHHILSREAMRPLDE